MTTIKIIDSIRCQQECGATETLMQSLWKPAGQFLVKVIIHLPCNTSIKILSIYTRETKIYVHTEASI